MNLKKILFICLILMILSITAVSAADSDNISSTDSIEPDQEIEPVNTIEHESNLEPVSKNKQVDLSKIQTPSRPIGSFDDLQLEIDMTKDGSVLILTRDYSCHYGSAIHIDKDITIDGQGHTLDCVAEKEQFAFYSTMGNIVLKNIKIINGHNDDTDQGGAIYIKGSAKYTLENCIFENNWADDKGGAIYNEGDVLSIKNCTFNGNIADDESGGAIYSTKDVIIENSTFTNNKADEYGGAIYCEGTVIVTADPTTKGYNSCFNYNHVDDNDGGAIYANAIYLENAEFKSNKAWENGGAVEFITHFAATDCLFESNIGYDYGGAISCEERSNDPYLERCIFKSNLASEDGGAIYMPYNDIYIINSTFEENIASESAGAIYAARIYINTNQAENETINTYFIKNSVKSTIGGAIYVSDGGKIVNAAFKSNTAIDEGGAIYCDEEGDLNIDHCLFESNTANDNGGAIYAKNDVYIHNSTFKGHYVKDYGGAIYAKNVRINYDRECETSDTFFIDNKAKDNDGGAIYAKDDVFARNVAFTNNTAYVDGGAIYAGKNVEVIRSIFESNQATGALTTRCYGGAIRAEENARINNCTFKNNYADNRGGSVHASTVTLEGGPSRFEGNSAKDYGGAIYTETFTNDLSHATFINNQAGDGGAVYINKENWITIKDCVFINNRATNKGGAIYIDSSNSRIGITDNVFINNIAGKEGHSIYNCGKYDIKSENLWSTIPTEYNNQLVEWLALSSNVQHTDSNPVAFTIEIIGSCCANLTSGVKISFVNQDGTPATLPMIAEYFSMSGVEGIEIEGKKVSSDSITILFTPTGVGTYELPAYILGMTGIMTINVIDGGAIIPVPLPEQDIIIPDIPKPVIPPTKTTNC